MKNVVSDDMYSNVLSISRTRIQKPRERAYACLVLNILGILNFFPFLILGDPFSTHASQQGINGGVYQVRTHKSGKSLVGPWNAAFCVDLDEDIRGRAYIHLELSHFIQRTVQQSQ